MITGMALFSTTKHEQLRRKRTVKVGTTLITNQNECELEQLIKVVNDLPKLIVHIIEGQCEQGQLDLFGHLKVFEPVTLSTNELFLPAADVIRYVSFSKL